MKKITILGDGGWGTALALILQRNGHKVTVWGPFEEILAEMRQAGENIRYLPKVPLPKEIHLTHRVEEAAEAEAAVLVVPSKFYRPVLERFSGLLPPSCLLVSATKGLDAGDGVHFRRMSEVAADVLGRKDIGALSGPSHAEEVARGVPSAVTLAHPNPDTADELQQMFSGPTFRVYTAEDVIGVELGGALKNVIAVAAGVSDGLGFGDNTKAALMTRGLAEMIRLGQAMGARPQTFRGLSGMGDLIVTCGSRLSRNRGVGERLGKGESIDEILASMQQVAEGIDNCVAAQSAARHFGVDVPITDGVCDIVQGKETPANVVQNLLQRDLKSEAVEPPP